MLRCQNVPHLITSKPHVTAILSNTNVGTRQPIVQLKGIVIDTVLPLLMILQCLILYLLVTIAYVLSSLLRTKQIYKSKCVVRASGSATFDAFVKK